VTGYFMHRIPKFTGVTIIQSMWDGDI
jgi:hypothetical protein